MKVARIVDISFRRGEASHRRNATIVTSRTRLSADSMRNNDLPLLSITKSMVFKSALKRYGAGEVVNSPLCPDGHLFILIEYLILEISEDTFYLCFCQKIAGIVTYPHVQKEQTASTPEAGYLAECSALAHGSSQTFHSRNKY